MICKYRNLGVAAMLVGATVATVLAQDAVMRVASGQREILLQANQSWNGKPYTHYPTGPTATHNDQVDQCAAYSVAMAHSSISELVYVLSGRSW